jgi:hypothetical protein
MAESPPYQPTAPSEPENDEQAPEEFVPFRERRPFLFRCLQMLLIGFILAVVAGGVLWYGTEPQFRSLAILLIHDKQPWLAFPDTEDSDGFPETQVDVLRGPFIIERAIQKENLTHIPELWEIAEMKDVVQWISQRLQVMRIGRSEMYEVSFTSLSPKSATRIVDAIVTTYLSFQIADSEFHLSRKLQFLNEEIAVYDKKIERSRSIVRELAMNQGGVDELVLLGGPGRVPGNGGPLTVQSLLEQKLLTAEIELVIATARTQALEDMVEAPIQITARQITDALVRDPEIDRLMFELAILRRTQDNANPEDKVRIGETIDARQKTLEDSTAERRSVLAAEAEAIVANQRRETLRLAQVDEHTAKVLVKILRDSLAERGPQPVHHGDKSLELQFARDELQQIENIRRHISDRVVHLTTEGRAPSRVMLLKPATLPEFPEDTGLWQHIVIAGAIALLAPLVLYVSYSVIAARWRASQLTAFWTIVK